MNKVGKKRNCEVLEHEVFLQERLFNIWDCFSEQRSDFNGRLHFHDFFELSVIYEGTSKFMVNGSEFIMGVKSLQLIRPTDYHRQLTGENEHIRYYNLMFASKFLSENLLKQLENSTGPLCAEASDSEWADLLKLIKEIMKEFTLAPDDQLTESFIKCNVENLCIYILRKSRQNKLQERTETVQEPVRRALEFVRNNYRRFITLSEAANAAGLSASYFSSLFHATMNISFSNYLTGYRLQMAERYLRTSDLSVKEIAAVCGFNSYPYFISAFKKEYGVSPAIWRNMPEKLKSR